MVQNTLPLSGDKHNMGGYLYDLAGLHWDPNCSPTVPLRPEV